MTIVAKVRPGKREEYLQAVRSLGDGEEEREGLKVTVSEGISDRSGLSLVLQWDRQEDMDRFLGAEKFSVLMGALRVLCEQSNITRKRG